MGNSLIFCALFACLAGAACGTDAARGAHGAADAASTADAVAQTDAAATGDVPFQNNWTQGYAAVLTFHGGNADGQTLKFERNLSGSQSIVSFGNSHLTPPAVSFGVDDTQSVMFKDKKSPMEVLLSFGILVQSAAQPVTTPKADTYPFQCNTPEIKINFQAHTYVSVCPKASGSIEITDWSAVPGGFFAGRIKGTLQNYYDLSLSKAERCEEAKLASSCQNNGLTVDVDIVYGFTLPEINSDQAP